MGHIVPGGAADMDGRIQTGDEIVQVDNYSVLKASHRQVVQLVNAAATRGQVNLILRRRIYPGPPLVQSYTLPGMHWLHEQPPPSIAHPGPPLQAETYDVTVRRNENEGFGFVIISSVNKIGSTIGK